MSFQKLLVRSKLHLKKQNARIVYKMNILTNIIILIIKSYKLIVSPLLGHNCRYLPSCSEYFIESLKIYGTIKGSYLGFKRILSCHPLKILGGGDGFDPVPIKKGSEKINGH